MDEDGGGIERSADPEMMSDACIRADERVMRHGSTELQAAMRLVLFILGREMARQQQANGSDKQLREP